MSAHQQPAWNHWYHCTSSTYGTWLPGDPRGWRTRDHRFHVDGDYKSRPWDTEWQRNLHARNAQRLKQPPMYLHSRRIRGVVLGALLRKFTEDHIECAAIAVARTHVHTLIRVLDGMPRVWLGRAKKSAMHALHRTDLMENEGRVWATRGLCKPIVNEAHFARALRYVWLHGDKEKAVTWVGDAYVRLVDEER